MRSLRRSSLLLWFITSMVISTPINAQAVPMDDYYLTGLAPLPGLPSCRPTDINDQNQVVGECCVDYLQTCSCSGFVWEHGVTAPIDPPLGRQGVTPSAINSQGDVVGLAWECGQTNSAFLLRAGEITELNDLLPAPQQHWHLSRAMDINDAGQIIGWAFIDDQQHGFLFDGETFVDLGTLGGALTEARALNVHGRVTGGSTNGGGDLIPFLWDEDVISGLEVFPGKATSAKGWAITDDDTVYGSYVAQDGFTDIPFRWSAGDTVALETGDNLDTHVHDVNNAGRAVGWGAQFSGQFFFDVACVWSDLSLFYLEDLVVNEWEHEIGVANGINSEGSITGASRASAGLLFHAFVASPLHSAEIFLDGFEFGNTRGWSASTP